MDETKLRYFASVARHLSFTKAAEDLNVVQSTVSKQISSLEKELGITLFYRDKQGISLTPAGRRLSEDVEDYLEQYRFVNESIRKLYSEFDYKLQVGIGPMEFNRAADVLSLFHKAQPLAEIMLTSYTYLRLVRHIRSITQDFAFCNELCAERISGVVKVPIALERWYPVGAADLPLWDMPLKDQRCLKDQTVITVFENQFEPVRPWCYEKGMKIKGFSTVNRLEPMISLLKAGHGIAIVPESLESNLGDGIIMNKTLFEEPLSLWSVAIYNEASRNSLINDLVECCVESGNMYAAKQK